jgi:formylglycine-generating enzyme required for sulfatase activity
MTNVSPEPDPRLSVFISYSRKDLAAAERLLDQLTGEGFDAYIDRQDILPGEPWRDRIAKLIEAADSVAFLISPDSIASPVCDWEVNEAERLGKRLLPVVVRETAPDLVPGRLARLNFIFMRDATEDAAGLERLSKAARTDIDWVREHTRLGGLAAEWRRRRHASELLLRGGALSAAELWISTRPPDGSVATDLQRDFINASRIEAMRQAVRAGRTQVLIGLLVIALLSGVGYLGWSNRASLGFQAKLLLDTYLPTPVSAASERSLKAGKTFRECASCPDMVVVPAGSFLMGSPVGAGEPLERPQHQVAIAHPFSVSRSLITFDQWDACTAHGGCRYRPDDQGWGRGTLPVTNVSWDDAMTYVAWLSKQTGKNYSLLTEAQWEYSAVAGRPTIYPWGNEVGVGKADCPDCGSRWDNQQPAPVGSFPPNAFGLYDMVGELWQWVQDDWHPNYVGAPQDGSAWLGGDASQRVLRGRAWSGGGETYTLFRDFARPHDFRNDIFGIRVARTLAIGGR